MSLFDYKCQDCQHEVVDVIETYDSYTGPRVCPNCQKQKLIRKDVYQTWFNFIGTGWSYGASNCNNFKV